MQAKLQNVVIPTRQFEQMRSFYRDILGFQVLNQGSGYCFLNAGGANIAIHTADPKTEFAPTGRGMYLDIVVTDVEAVRDRLSTGNVAIRKEWVDHNGQFLLVSDPDGNLLELYRPKSRDSEPRQGGSDH